MLLPIMSESIDELITAQNELIGVLFEIIKRLQSNNELDTEYLQIVTKEKQSETDTARLNEISNERDENAKVISRLLEKIESNQ